MNQNQLIEEARRAITGAVNMLLGMTMDPAIPTHARQAMNVKAGELQETLEALESE